MRYKQKSKMEGKNHINNSIKYEWNKHSNQKRDCQIRLKKKQVLSICCLSETTVGLKTQKD